MLGLDAAGLNCVSVGLCCLGLGFGICERPDKRHSDGHGYVSRETML